MFKKYFQNSAKKKLEKKYAKLLKEAYRLSTINRTLSDQKIAEANHVLQQINS
ncbi:Lacal_2735 family protein [Reichenbachiella sp.]|uniref:Lacal_2735 family protein n=1 Tax=Reichenbachiella sp. TaxID=2184521 RepID=UPI003B5CFC65